MKPGEGVSRAASASAAAEGMKRNGGLPDRLDQWRQAHPFRSAAWRVERTGGFVFAYAGVVYYFGRCRLCDARVTTQRRETRSVSGNGRWPELCGLCSAAAVSDPYGTKNRHRVRMSRNPHRVDLRQYNNRPDESRRN